MHFTAGFIVWIRRLINPHGLTMKMWLYYNFIVNWAIIGLKLRDIFLEGKHAFFFVFEQQTSKYWNRQIMSLSTLSVFVFFIGVDILTKFCKQRYWLMFHFIDVIRTETSSCFVPISCECKMCSELFSVLLVCVTNGKNTTDNESYLLVIVHLLCFIDLTTR